MARRFWGSPEQALGKRIQFGRGSWRSVVGVARDIKYARVTEDPRPHIYLPFWQLYRSNMTFHVRSRDAAPALLERVRAIVQRLDPNLPILNARMLTDQTRSALSVFSMAAGVLMTFGVIAMILTALGTYGMVSYAARQSTHEIGIRIAIGANRADVLRGFLGRGLRLGIVGAVCGLALSAAATRLLASLLYGVSPTDAASFTGASTLVMTIVASWPRSSRHGERHASIRSRRSVIADEGFAVVHGPRSSVSIWFSPNPESRIRIPDPVYFLIVPVTPSGEQLNGSIFSADGAYSFLDRGNGCLKNSGSVRSISTTRR